MGLFSKIFGTYSEKEIKKITPIVDKIEALADKFAALEEDDMPRYTLALKERLKNGETLDDILPEAFALVREADARVLGKRPFRVQLMGGILLHQGRIAEMKTGEGKTLVATLPAYLNALTGNGVHIVTVNDYLATRDSEEMGRVYSYLGLTTGLIVHGQDPEEKKAAYAADITYATNNELGFDYLRDNMVVYKENMVQRGHAFAIIDEVDSILIDEARTPLIISGMGSESTQLYTDADKCARKLKPFVIKEMDMKRDTDEYEEDYIVDEKARTAVLTQHGITKVEEAFGIENLSDPENSLLLHHINNAIKARGVMKRDVDYIIKDGEVIIVDTFTGRLMPGRRYNNGLHQAIEAKENVKVQKESKTVATVTFQNYFRMYKKLSGMTGTAMTEDNEFRQIYALDVVEVPTNKPMIRIDHKDSVYRTMRGKMLAIIKQIKECHEKGQPVLVGTVSVEKSELLSTLLTKAGVPHSVLNAKQHAKEAEIVAKAGHFGAVTISTNMAGRGTDIMLGGNAEYMAKCEMRRRGIDEELVTLSAGTAEEDRPDVLEARALYKELYAHFTEKIKPEADRVRAVGGLYILGTERHESRRIDNQLRGRSGRQGDPGESRFFISFDDDLMRLFGATERLVSLAERMGLPEDEPIIGKAMLTSAIESAQRRIESSNFERRKRVLGYDDVMNQQRSLIYEQRREVLFKDDISDTITDMITSSVSETFDKCFSGSPEEYNLDEFRTHYLGLVTDSHNLNYTAEQLSALDRDAWRAELISSALDRYHSKRELFSNLKGLPPDAWREIEKTILLRTVDEKWMQHLEDNDELKEYVGLNSYAQRDPVAVYRMEAADLFDQMIHDIKETTVRSVLSAVPRASIPKREQVAKNLETVGEDKSARRPAVSKKVGRNDDCPCGSGEKYKKCCGRNKK